MTLILLYVLPIFCLAILFVHQFLGRPTGKRSSKRDKKRINIQKFYISRKEQEFDDLQEISQLNIDKQLYHRLQNLEYYPNALIPAYNRLLSLFDAAIESALTSSKPTILQAVPDYSPELLNDFLNQDYEDVSQRYQAYLERRKQGGPREIFQDYEYARYWLRTVAPVKFVDGAWLGGVHRITTKFQNRPITKILWQVLSEELGDGDIQKNHVWVYQELLKSIDAADIGTGDSKEFISSSHNLNNNVRVWRAALAQLCISLFPDLFLPEILGFNLSYESLPLHLLITVHELRELNIDPYYFVLHISIDNKHSGHAAMGLNAVHTYMSSIPIEERTSVWKRIQAGFILASELPTTPASRSTLDQSVEKIFAEKCQAAQPMHRSCPAKIGGRTGKKLSDWLNPNTYSTHSLAFVRALADSRWIVRGKPEKSRLITELKWGGRMFGAFTSEEVTILEAWIRELEIDNQTSQRTNSYENLTGVKICPPDSAVARSSTSQISITHLRNSTTMPLESLSKKNHILRSLLSLSAVPFEYLSSLPAKCASSYGMTVNRCLRALYGFLPESDVCAGMHEVLTNNSNACGVVEIAQISLAEIDDSLREFTNNLLHLSTFPEQNESILVGLQSGFVDYVLEACQQLEEVSSERKCQLNDIRSRCQKAIGDLVKEKNDNTEWVKQMTIGKMIIKDLVAPLIH